MLIYLIVFSSLIFLIGVIGFLSVRLNIFIWLLSIEIMAFSSTLNFLWCSIFYDDISGQIFALLILAIVAAESAFALILLVSIVKLNKTTNFNYIYNIKM